MQQQGEEKNEVEDWDVSGQETKSILRAQILCSPFLYIRFQIISLEILKCMPENLETAYQGILDAVHSGEITEERIDESVYRIWQVKAEQ